MRAVAKSETLALSMELKGFGANTYKNMPQQKLGLADYVVHNSPYQKKINH